MISSENINITRRSSYSNHIAKPRFFYTLCLFISSTIILCGVYLLYTPNSDNRNLTSEIEKRYGQLEGSSSGLPQDSEQPADNGEQISELKVNENEEEEHAQLKLRHQQHNHDHKFRQQYSLISNLVELRLFHLDLKGAPPNLGYLKQVLHLAKASGLNGLLLEWEDTFPYSGILENVKLGKGAYYTKEEVRELIDFAELVLDFEVIPLVQTFGHVEFILKGEEFKELREVPYDPQSFCPSKNGTLDVIREMIDQILSFHHRSRFLHIGCDEVYNLQVCPLCKSKASTISREDLFLSHVTSVASYVRQEKARIPIIWDDMLRSIPMKQLNDSGIGNLVEIMVWVYAEDVDRFVGWENWEKYSEIFPTVWGAAAFKGAFGESLSIPPVYRHVENVKRWTSVIERESGKWGMGVGGVVLTGWSRYDHFSVLCELLVAAVPSLVYTGLQVSTPMTGSDENENVRIKNRMFLKEGEHNRPLMNHTEEEQTTTTDDPAHTLDKRQLSVSHPRSLMIPRLVDPNKSPEEKRQFIISKSFQQILQCPNYPTPISSLLKNSDHDLSYAGRCNFSGVPFYRSLFRLKPLMKEIDEVLDKIERKSGWMREYNLRHNYSLPLRVDELLLEVPRLRVQLEVTSRSIQLGLHTIYRREIILEWIEQNIWETWGKLRKYEIEGERLKGVGVWGRRPLKSPKEMVAELGLTGGNDEL